MWRRETNETPNDLLFSAGISSEFDRNEWIFQAHAHMPHSLHAPLIQWLTEWRPRRVIIQWLRKIIYANVNQAANVELMTPNGFLFSSFLSQNFFGFFSLSLFCLENLPNKNCTKTNEFQTIATPDSFHAKIFEWKIRKLLVQPILMWCTFQRNAPNVDDWQFWKQFCSFEHLCGGRKMKGKTTKSFRSVCFEYFNYLLWRRQQANEIRSANVSST